jgi:selenide,water dikinase
MGLLPAGTYRNKKHIENKYSSSIDEEYIMDLLFDPQTSGGLLYSLPEPEAMKLLRDLEENGIEGFIAGYVTEFESKHIFIE